jgi:hypothetical protein
MRLVLFLALPLLAHAATYTAASTSYADVNDCVASGGANTCSPGGSHTAVDGDIIQIPSGSSTWTTQLTIPSGVGVTLIGSGSPQSGSGTTGASGSCNGTAITMNQGGIAIRATPSYGNSTTRFSCMLIEPGASGAIAFSVLGACTSSGCPNLRMDNITFTNWTPVVEVGNSYGITAIGDMFGVIDHNTINGVASHYLQLVELSHASYLGVGQYGDNSWAQSENYGSANFLFFENNNFIDSGCCENEGSAGGLTRQGGGRIVVRYNTFSPTDSFNFSLGWHGTESSGRPRSGRTWEYYENTWACNSPTNGCPPVIGARGGTGLTWGNTFTATSGSTFATVLAMNTYRTQGSQPDWGVCDGSQVFDTNDGTAYYSDTIASVSGSGPYTITVSGTPGWTTNQWVSNGSPYSVHDVTKTTGSEITANGSNTLTLAYSGGPGAWTPATSDSIQILRATVCIDQSGGRGSGFLYSGSTPQSDAATEAVSPSYLWTNSQGGASGGSATSGADTKRVIANRDYYTETINQGIQTSATSPFNGTSGVGHGTLANRPTTCTANSWGSGTGVAYWETDHNQLDFCNSTNTWSTTSSTPASYTPYTYPHPLDTGSVAGNPPPSVFVIQP